MIEIDRYGKRLIGCLGCNCWRGGRSLFISTCIRRSEMVRKRVAFVDETWQAIDRLQIRVAA
jgi:hypothetical protein